MPVLDIQKRQATLSRLGIIRLGVKHPEKGYPMDKNHFVLTDAPDLVQAYGEQPQEMLIYLPFGTVDANFPAHHELWSATGCLCRGDGEKIVDLLDPQNGGVRVIRQGQVIRPYLEEDGQSYVAGDIVACPGLNHEELGFYPRCAECRPRGMLIVMVRDPERPSQLVGDRLGYYQISTHSFYNIQNLTGQLHYAEDLAAQMGRDLRGIPLILRRVEREINYTDQKGERRKVKKWLLDLEFDLAWVRLANATMHSMALSAPVEIRALPAGAVIDAETGEIVDDYDDAEAMVSPQQAAAQLRAATQQVRERGLAGADLRPNGKRPYDPEAFQARWDEVLPSYEAKYSADEGSIDDGLRGLLCGRIEGFFSDDEKPVREKYRHTFLLWLTGKDSSKRLSQAEGKLLLKLLDDGHAISEVRAIIRQDAVDKGQTEFSITNEPPF